MGWFRFDWVSLAIFFYFPVLSWNLSNQCDVCKVSFPWTGTYIHTRCWVCVGGLVGLLEGWLSDVGLMSTGLVRRVPFRAKCPVSERRPSAIWSGHRCRGGWGVGRRSTPLMNILKIIIDFLLRSNVFQISYPFWTQTNIVNLKKWRDSKPTKWLTITDCHTTISSHTFLS